MVVEEEEEGEVVAEVTFAEEIVMATEVDQEEVIKIKTLLEDHRRQVGMVVVIKIIVVGLRQQDIISSLVIITKEAAISNRIPINNKVKVVEAVISNKILISNKVKVVGGKVDGVEEEVITVPSRTHLVKRLEEVANPTRKVVLLKGGILIRADVTKPRRSC